MSLEMLRREIETVTWRVLEAVASRARLVQTVAAVKTGQNLPRRDAAREEDLLRAAEECAPSPLSGRAARAVTRAVIDACLDAVDGSGMREMLVSRSGGRAVAAVGIGEGLPRAWIAGPCSVESVAQVDAVAGSLAALGVNHLRGGAFKPRTSPYDFQGRGLAALLELSRAARTRGMWSVSEATGESVVDEVADSVDVIQIGARNCQSYDLLRAVAIAAAARGRSVMLKRGPGTTIAEWISAAEYIANAGCEHILLCERGIRTFEPSTRYTLDLSAVAVARVMTRLPIVVDVSHPAGRRDLLVPLAAAAYATGADAVMVEVHPDPDLALSDSAQQVTPEAFAALKQEVDARVPWRT